MKKNAFFKYYIFTFLCFLSISTFGQTANDYRTVASGNWNAAGVWEKFLSGTWTAIASGPTTAAFGTNVTITAGHTVTVNLAVITDQLVISSGAAITISSGNTLTIASGAGQDITIISGGTLTVNGSFVLNAIATGIVTGKIVNSGTFTNSGAITMNSTSLYQHNFSSALPAAGTIPILTWNANATCEIIACGNAGPPAGLNQPFGNFKWNNSTQPGPIDLLAKPTTVNGDFEIVSTNSNNLYYKTITSGSLTITDSLKISGGIFFLTNGTQSSLITSKVFYQTGGTLNMSGPASNQNGFFSISKAFTHNAGTFCETGTASGCEVKMTGTTASTIQSIGFTSGCAINFIVAESSTSCTIPTGTNFVLNPGTYFILNDNGILFDRDLIINGRFVTNTSTWNFNSPSKCNVYGTFWNNFLTLGSSNDSILTIDSTGFFRHNVNGGEVVMATWDEQSTLQVSGMTTSDTLGNGNQTFGKILWKSPNQTVSAYFGRQSSVDNFSTQSDFTIDSTGTALLRFPDFNFTIGGDLTVSSNAVLQLSYGTGLYTPNSRTFTINGDVKILNSALLTTGSPNTGAIPEIGNLTRNFILNMKGDFTHTSTTPLISMIHRSFSAVADDGSYHLQLNFSGTSATVQNITMQIQASNTITFAGDGIANNATDDDFRSNNLYSINVNGTNNRLKTLSNIKYCSLFVNNLTANSDTLDMTGGTFNLIHYPLLGTDGILTNAVTIINHNGVLDFGNSSLTEATGDGSFRLRRLSEIRTKHVQGISTTASTGCLPITANDSLASNATYCYNGSTAQVTGNALPVNMTGTLEIDNSTPLATGGVTLTTSNTITTGGTSTLKLTNGKLLTSSTTLITIGNNSNVSPAGGSATSFVDGPVSKIGFAVTPAEFVFPTGDTAKWARIGFVSATANTALAYTAEYFKRDPHTNCDATFIDSTLDWPNLKKISYQEYWSLNRTAGTINGKVKLYFEDATFSGISSASTTDLRVAHFKTVGPKWYSEGTVTIPTAGSVMTTANVVYVSGYPYFTFGAPNTVNPLPIELLSFNAYKAPEGHLLNWKTATETNNDFFEIERSFDGVEFSQIGLMDGFGNSTSIVTYEFPDRYPLDGINYYRLKQVDFNGDYSYSEVIALDNSSEEDALVSVYPNPSTDGQIQIHLTKGISSLAIYNVLGEELYSVVCNSQENKNLSFEALSSGVYFITAVSDSGKIISSKFIRN
ncbi:MAG: T9SS type A sorting domain-containing protein [Bacteroidota bacterium]|nr:T9SS type A sorting domain-containing protein [Bacteroidota bacterium]